MSQLLLNHAISDELTTIYDRAERWQQRVEAAARWADHVVGLAESSGGAVVPLRTGRYLPPGAARAMARAAGWNLPDHFN